MVLFRYQYCGIYFEILALRRYFLDFYEQHENSVEISYMYIEATTSYNTLYYFLYFLRSLHPVDS